MTSSLPESQGATAASFSFQALEDLQVQLVNKAASASQLASSFDVTFGPFFCVNKFYSPFEYVKLFFFFLCYFQIYTFLKTEIFENVLIYHVNIGCDSSLVFCMF